MRTCRSCGATKKRGHYLCGACWYGLNATTRRRLWKTDGQAMERLMDLYDQIDAGRPLPEIEVTP